MSTPTAKTPSTTNLPCNRYWTSLRPECKKCKDKMKCPMYLAHWKKHQKLMRRWIWAKMLESVVPKRQRRRRKNRRLNDNATEKTDWKEQTWKHSQEPKVKALIPMYEPLQVSKCEKCGKIINTSQRINVGFGCGFRFIWFQMMTKRGN